MAVERKRLAIDCGKDSVATGGRTVQSEAPACDINKMMALYQKTGVIPQSQRVPQYGDFSNTMDYMEAKKLTENANRMFDALPALIRKRFENDPAQLLMFMEDHENRTEAEELGLVQKAAETPQPETPPVVPPASESESE